VSSKTRQPVEYPDHSYGLSGLTRSAPQSVEKESRLAMRGGQCSAKSQGFCRIKLYYKKKPPASKTGKNQKRNHMAGLQGEP
jgi:hypothetical protein